MRIKHSKLVATLLVALVAAPVTVCADALDDASVRLFNVQKSMAEKKNNSHAQFYLAQMYELGLGTREDPAQARSWYERAAAGGHPMAQRQLREMDRHEKEAALERQRAAEQVKAAVAAPLELPKTAPAPLPPAAEVARPRAVPVPVATPEAKTHEQERREAEAKARAERKRAVEAFLRKQLANPRQEVFE
jgi:TPR repeat protein